MTDRAATSIVIAHLSDCHLPNVKGFAPRYWNVKRAFGWLNWQLKRKQIHTSAAIGAILADIHAVAPDHIAVTGDLVNIGLPAEYEAAGAWLATVGPPERVSVVPGNHDIYVEPEGSAGVALWGAYMRSDALGGELEPGSGDRAGLAFPYIRRVGPVAIIGVNSSCATAVGYADGEVGDGQRQRLAAALDRLGRDGLGRVVLIHHPPKPGLTAAHRSIRDGAELEALIARHGAELVLHGHNHRVSHARIGEARIDGIASASASRPYRREPAACYTLYRIDCEGSRLVMRAELRALGADADMQVQIIGTSEFECGMVAARPANSPPVSKPARRGEGDRK